MKGHLQGPWDQTNGELSITCLALPGSSVDKENLQGAGKEVPCLVGIAPVSMSKVIQYPLHNEG